MEKENQFLRLEVERIKYGKDKDQYNKFISGLMKHRPQTGKISTNSFDE
jgi:RNA:NAD 2'-phosphotransferase (TPT1/KptA family)